MKCLETEKLIGYAYHLMDETAASEVRVHLGECPHCREIVAQYGRLDVVLDEWKAADPTPGFDVRVRQAIEARHSGRSTWGFWNWGWSHGLALAGLAVLIAAGAVWFARSHRQVSNSAAVSVQPTQPAGSVPAPGQVAKLHVPGVPPNADARSAKHDPGPNSAGAASTDDKDAQALEDYDMAANFDVLSELPKGDSRVAD